MIFIFVGHRGTGKTQFATRNFLGKTVDLDAKIQRDSGRSPGQIIEEQGEIFFRQLEHQTLKTILLPLLPNAATVDHFVVLGAGFDLDRFDWPKTQHLERVWLRRSTDQRGRVFTNRPRLDPKLSPLAEFQARFQEREVGYGQFADWILEIPEGEHLRASSVAASLFSSSSSGALRSQGGIFTLRAGDRQRSEIIQRRFLHWGFQAFELRTDLLSPEDLAFWLRTLPARQVLWAERIGQRPLRIENENLEIFDWDWALELGEPPAGLAIQSLSFHGSDRSQFGVRSPNLHLKWSPRIESWQDLWAGYEWQQQDPQRRSFLPRSAHGRWTWFRLLMKGKQRLNFVREFAAADAPDQPALVEWIAHQQGSGFAAILGDPVDHSWTPGIHADFFKQKNMPVLRIQIQESEWAQALPCLEKLGLCAAAVTSPLKKEALRWSAQVSDRARGLQAVNTLKRQGKKWSADNTDSTGLHQVLQEQGLDAWQGPVMVWGGGGTLQVLRELFPQAAFYSVRSQALREDSPPAAGIVKDSLWIWAAGPQDPLPEFAAQPAIVLDLNYREDSNARELALRHRARYISGEAMFRFQAAEQQLFWKDLTIERQ